MAKLELVLLFGIVVLGLAADDTNVTLKYADIIDYLRTKSDADVIPISLKDPKPVVVRLEMSLLYVVRVDPQTDVIELIVRLRQTWYNKALVWDQTRPNFNVENVTLPLRYLWEPDITATSAVNTPELLSPEVAVVSSNGEVQFDNQLHLVLHSKVNGYDTPTGANITFTYQSWTYDNTQLTLAEPLASCFVIDEFESQTFQASNAHVIKSVVQSPTTSRYFDVHNFTFILKKVQ